MPIFSNPVESVADVNIFARKSTDRQVLVLSLRMTCSTETALIIPIPSAQGAGREALRLLAMDSSGFFASLRKGFGRSGGERRRREENSDVDDQARTVRFTYAKPYDTFYLPSAQDFALVMPEFRIPDRLTSSFSPYLDHGFAVFKLHPGKNMRLGPLAFSFPVQDDDHLFFPTFEFHDGVVRSASDLDVTLYCQMAERSGWETSADEVDTFLDVSDLPEIVQPGRTVQRRIIYGASANEDIWLAV